MTGSILENLSNKKLAIIVSIVLVVQLSCFLIGGLVAPAPSHADQVLGTICLREDGLPAGVFDDNWSIPRGPGNKPVNCTHINNIEDVAKLGRNVSANNVVFAFQIPLPRSRTDLDYSRWMQNLIGILHMDIVYNPNNPLKQDPLLHLEIKMGYRNKHESAETWHLIANSTEERRLHCDLNNTAVIAGHSYNCDALNMFELGSLHHDFYLINMRFPIDDAQQWNRQLGHIGDVWLIVIHQNGGFTKVWVALKSFFFPIVLATLIWYWHRIRLMVRPPSLIECLIMCVACAMTLLNLPLEYLTLLVDMPYMLLLSDIRQGIFYAALLSFWLVFCGEHLMDDVERNRIRPYWKHLSAVFSGCLCLFAFDMCERGVQLKNPFYSIWASDIGNELALGFIVLALASACVYLLFLTYMLYRVMKNIGFKRNSLPSMSVARRMYYEGIIFRFKFLVLATQICAALTVIAYILGQVSEGKWKWDEDIELEYTSAFFTGVYGMWNCYIFMLLVLYAPSHKFKPQEAPTRTVSTLSQDEIEFSRLTASVASEHPGATCGAEATESTSLTDFARKAAFD